MFVDHTLLGNVSGGEHKNCSRRGAEGVAWDQITKAPWAKVRLGGRPGSPGGFGAEE